MVHVIRSFDRPAPEHVALLSKFAPATHHEALGRRGALDSRIKPVAPGMKFCGPAVTAMCHIGDNLMVFEAINLAQPGDVVVVSAGNNPEQGGFGEVLATACMSRKIAAFVIDAGVRDGAALRTLGFPVFCLGLCMKGTVKDTLGTVNHPIVIGGEVVRPGDVLCGDDDGIVVIRREEAEHVAKVGAEREAREAQVMQRYRDGGSFAEGPQYVARSKIMRERGCTWAN